MLAVIRMIPVTGSDVGQRMWGIAQWIVRRIECAGLYCVNFRADCYQGIAESIHLR